MTVILQAKELGHILMEHPITAGVEEDSWVQKARMQSINGKC
jgi:hypothetical protein